jgi:hypothetical protein
MYAKGNVSDRFNSKSLRNRYCVRQLPLRLKLYEVQAEEPLRDNTASIPLLSKQVFLLKKYFKNEWELCLDL